MEYLDIAKKKASETASLLWAGDDSDMSFNEHQIVQEKKLQTCWLNEEPHNDQKISEELWEEMTRN
jgi:hypothetical protein